MNAPCIGIGTRGPATADDKTKAPRQGATGLMALEPACVRITCIPP